MRYVLPGQPGSRVKVDRRYENFIGGRGLAPAEAECQINQSFSIGRRNADVTRPRPADADRALDPLPGATDASGDAPGTARVELFTA